METMVFMDYPLMFALFGVLGAAIAALVGWKALPLGKMLGLMDEPDGANGRKRHKMATPLVGGLGFALAVLAASALFLLMGELNGLRLVVLWLMVSVGFLFLLGAIDDRWHLSPAFRLAGIALFFLVPILQVPYFRLDALIFSVDGWAVAMPGLVGVGFTLLCMVGLKNAVNMADGKNGLVLGQAIIWSLVLFVHLPPSLHLLNIAVLGALVVLFLCNMRGKLFLGDGGSYAVSGYFGLMAVVAWNHRGPGLYADDIALIFALPVFDTLRLMVHRVLAGRTPFTPGRDHLHHYLYDHWGWPGPLPWVLALVAIPNMLALLLPGTGIVWLLVTLLLYLLMLVVAIRPVAVQNV